MENIFFKQSFMGFDRSQVLEYINNLIQEMHQQADDYEDKVHTLERDIDDFTKQLADCQESLAISSESSQKLAREVDSLKQTNSQLRERTKTYVETIKERNKELALVKEDCNRLSRRAFRLEQENRQWKSKQDEIATCLVEASVRAKQIIERANAKAAISKRQFDRNASGLMTRVVDVRAEIARLEKQLEESFQKLSQAMRNMDAAGSLIESQIQDYQNRVQRLDKTKVDVSLDEGEIPEEPKAKKTLTDSVLDSISKLLDR